MTVARVGGRVLLVDPAERVLLIHERLEDGSTHWLTPGGGVEGDEHPREAARREAIEETGIVVDLADDAEAVLVTRRVWSWAGVDYDQVDHFFLARIGDVAPEPRALTGVEQQTFLGFGWWTVAQLRSSYAAFLPEHLADVLDGLLRTGRAG